MCYPVQYVLDAAVAATGTGVKGSASRSRPTVTLNLPGIGAGHLGGHQRSSVNVNGRLPFKVCHSFDDNELGRYPQFSQSGH